MTVSHKGHRYYLIARSGAHDVQLPLRCTNGPPRGNVVVSLELDRAVLQHVFLADGRTLGLDLLSIALTRR